MASDLLIMLAIFHFEHASFDHTTETYLGKILLEFFAFSFKQSFPLRSTLGILHVVARVLFGVPTIAVIFLGKVESRFLHEANSFSEAMVDMEASMWCQKIIRKSVPESHLVQGLRRTIK